MKLSILMPALSSRNWQRMFRTLQAQTKYFAKDTVEIKVELDNGEASSGVKRQRLMENAEGEYIVFVDDDDLIHDNYVAALISELASNPDLITFKLELQNRSHNKKEVWQFGLHNDQRRHGLMAANHLCVWRRDIAIKVGWCPELGYADDQLWYQPLLAANLVKHVRHINRVLYFYIFNPVTSANQSSDRITFTKQYVGKGLRCFWHNDEILIEAGGGVNLLNTNEIIVRNAKNELSVMPLRDMTLFHTIRVL